MKSNTINRIIILCGILFICVVCFLCSCANNEINNNFETIPHGMTSDGFTNLSTNISNTKPSIEETTIVPELKPCVHEFNDIFNFDESGHWNVCILCDEINEVINHNMSIDDNDCTTSIVCVDCGFVLINGNTMHTFSNQLTHDDISHWYVCQNTNCNITSDKINHKSSTPTGDCTENIICIDCNYIINTGMNTHNFTSDFISDTGYHWNKCTNANCMQINNKTEHTFNIEDNDCTTSVFCSDCKYVLVNANNNHSFDGPIYTDDKYHWIACSNENCNIVGEKEEHISNGYPTEYENEYCIECNRILKSKMNFKEVNETVWVVSTVNIRENPSTSANKFGQFKTNEKLIRIGISDEGWSKISWNGKIVYCSSDYLTKDEPIIYPMTYEDETMKITITREWYENAWCYVAHLEFSDYTRFGTSCANGRYKNGYETTSNAAKRLSAIFAVNGCYSAPYLNYGVIRNGVVCHENKVGYVAGYSSATGIFGDIVKNKYTGPTLAELAESKTVTDTFCFGPAFLVDGKVLTNTDTSRAQRTFIGTNGNPGDIWIVVSDGRYIDGESAGLRYNQCAQLLLNKGCTYGIPLDGGGSSTMVFKGHVLNAVKKERAVVDFIFVK